jgi:phage gp29-like protein
LDWADIAFSDMIINPSVWSQADGSSGVSAYLGSIYVHINQDALEQKYEIAPDGTSPEDDTE